VPLQHLAAALHAALALRVRGARHCRCRRSQMHARHDCSLRWWHAAARRRAEAARRSCGDCGSQARHSLRSERAICGLYRRDVVSLYQLELSLPRSQPVCRVAGRHVELTGAGAARQPPRSG
jgi:hypothetical protein